MLVCKGLKLKGVDLVFVRGYRLTSTYFIRLLQQLSIYRNLTLLRGHRPSTTVRLSSWLHGWSVILKSTSRSRRQVFLGRPLFLLPWGFQQRAQACLVTLDVVLRRACPIYFHLRLVISSSAGIWLVSLQRSIQRTKNFETRCPPSSFTFFGSVFFFCFVERMTVVDHAKNSSQSDIEISLVIVTKMITVTSEI